MKEPQLNASTNKRAKESRNQNPISSSGEPGASRKLRGLSWDNYLPRSQLTGKTRERYLSTCRMVLPGSIVQCGEADSLAWNGPGNGRRSATRTTLTAPSLLKAAVLIASSMTPAGPTSTQHLLRYGDDLFSISRCLSANIGSLSTFRPPPPGFPTLGHVARRAGYKHRLCCRQHSSQPH